MGAGKTRKTQDTQTSHSDVSFERLNRLGTTKVSKLMLEFVIPSVVSLMVNGFYTVIDSIFLGRGVGEIGLATITVATPLLSVGMSLSMLLAAGGNALAALRLGEGKNEDAEKILGNTLVLMIGFCAFLALFTTIFIDPLMIISGVTEDTWNSSKTFILILTYGYILQFIGMGFNNFIRTAGAPNRALATSLTGTVVCIALNYLFVLVFNWGVAGSAYATIIGQAVSAALMVWFFISSPKAPFKLRFKNLRPKASIGTGIIMLGSASFVMSIAMTLGSFIINNLLVFYGAMHPIGSEGALATIGVIQRLNSFMFFPLIGVAIAAQPLWGYNYGAKNYLRVKKTTSISLLWMFIIGVFLWLIIIIFPRQILGIFGLDQALTDFSVFALMVQMSLFPIVGVQIVGANYFQSTGQPVKSVLLSLTRQLLYLFPLFFILPNVMTLLFPSLAPLDTIYFAFPISDALAIVTATAMLALEYRKLNKHTASNKDARRAT
jgi:putative MATE family efflux protein